MDARCTGGGAMIAQKRESTHSKASKANSSRPSSHSGFLLFRLLPPGTIYVKNLYHGTIFHLSSLTTAGSGHGHHHYLEQKRFCCCSCRRSPVPSTIRTFSLWLSILAENEAGTWCLGTWRPPQPGQSQAWGLIPVWIRSVTS